MGTNFYTLSGKHIGKRSAAGPYCWDCSITLRKGGKDNVHDSGGFIVLANNSLSDYIKHIESLWYDECPQCHTKETIERFKDTSGGRELGLNKKPFKRKKGVRTCSSFSWDIHPEELKRIRYVKNEYGEKFTINEFHKILEECPIQFYDSIGNDFS